MSAEAVQLNNEEQQAESEAEAELEAQAEPVVIIKLSKNNSFVLLKSFEL